MVEFLQLLWCLEDCWHSVSLRVCRMSFSGIWRLYPFVESVTTMLEDCWHSVSLRVCRMSFSGIWRLPFCLVESVMTVYHSLASVNLKNLEWQYIKNLEWQYTIFWPLLVWRLWNDSISFSLMELLATLFLVYHKVYKKAKYAAQTLKWPLYFPQDTEYVLYSVVTFRIQSTYFIHKVCTLLSSKVTFRIQSTYFIHKVCTLLSSKVTFRIQSMYLVCYPLNPSRFL